LKIVKGLDDYFRDYRDSAAGNDDTWSQFTSLTDTVPYLKQHRDWVEANGWGFGDRAFHYMWYLLLNHDVLQRKRPRLLEIGVYMGQVVSLWALITARTGAASEIYGITPLVGSGTHVPTIFRRMWYHLSSTYREEVQSANIYKSQDYDRAIRRIFTQFDLPFLQLKLIRGYSQEPHVRAVLDDVGFDVIYIDGGHRYEDVAEDLRWYAPRVNPGGYLVLDDAAYFQPGTQFYKGHEAVSRAVEDWECNGFTNVLNVGHNRIFRRTD
jgi:hypothetical protein